MGKEHKLLEVKYIEPTDIPKLSPDDLILVSRIVLNNARAYSNLPSAKRDKEAITALLKACQLLYAQDDEKNYPCFGVEIRAEEVNIIFKNQLEYLPKRSFIINSKLCPT